MSPNIFVGNERIKENVADEFRQPIFLFSTANHRPIGFLKALCGHVPQGSKNPLHYGLARRLFKAREASGMSAGRVALSAGLSEPTVRNIEDGTIPSLDTLELICAVIGVDPGWVAYGWEGYEPFQERRPRELVPRADPSPHGPLPYKARSVECGRRIREAREATGLSMRKLAAVAHISVQGWSKMEAGAMLRVDTLEERARVLGVAPAWLAYGDEPT